MKTIVCLSCQFKGNDFLKEAKKLGNYLILITSESLKDEAWERDSVDEFYYMPEIKESYWKMDFLIKGISHLLKTRKIDSIVAFDDFDVEKAAELRETFRIPGMGMTTYRYFRDKLAMRQKAKDAEIKIPEFTSIFNDEKINHFIEKNQSPWMLKPRSDASTHGIEIIENKDELWQAIHKLGDERMNYLLESFEPGEVYHVDSLIANGRMVFSNFSKYLKPPFEVTRKGGVFCTVNVGRRSKDAEELTKINRKVMTSFGIRDGVSHSEYIKGKDGEFYFLETSSRMAGAHIPTMIEAATGINFWSEWAKIETQSLRGEKYISPAPVRFYAGLLLAMTTNKKPDIQPFVNNEFYKEVFKDYHIGVVYRADKPEILMERIENAMDYIKENLMISN